MTMHCTTGVMSGKRSVVISGVLVQMDGWSANDLNQIPLSLIVRQIRNVLCVAGT